MAQPWLVIVTLLSGEGATGVETHFNLLAAAASARGARVFTVTPYSTARVWRAPFRPLKNLPQENLRVAYRWTQALLLRRQVARLLARAGAREVTLYSQCPLAARMAVLAARGRPRVRRVAVVHYNLSEAAETVAAGRARADGPLARHLARIEAPALLGSDAVLFVSDYMRRIVNGRLPALAARPQATIPNFPAPGEAAPPAAAAADLIAIGSLEPRKNQQYLVRVLHEARRRGRRYTLTVVGTGPDAAALAELAARLDVAGQVNFLGFQPRASQLIPGHRVLVHAATMENCPLIIAEALCAGRPVAAAPVGGIPEMFRDGVEGIYWDVSNPGQGAARLIDLLETPGRYAGTAAAARRHYETAFAPIAAQWLQWLFPARAAAGAGGAAGRAWCGARLSVS